MKSNKTVPTAVSVLKYLSSCSANRQEDSNKLINVMSNISGLDPVMWGPSIIGFGSQHYKYDSGREGDMPLLSFSPRKQSISVYFMEGFDNYGEYLNKLGQHKTSRACLYINNLADIDINTLKNMLKQSFKNATKATIKPETVEDYCNQVPVAAKKQFIELRTLVQKTLPEAKEVLSYGVIGYKVDEKRPRVFISGFKDHLGIYPVPKNEELKQKLSPYIKGKGTMWFSLDTPLPENDIILAVKTLAYDY